MKTDRQKEWTRRILACAHAPRLPPPWVDDGKYRDTQAILWVRRNEAWHLAFHDKATIAGLIERLRTAELVVSSTAYPTYTGKWGDYETVPLDEPGEVIALLYEAHMLRYVPRMESAHVD